MKISFITAVNDYKLYKDYCLPSLPDGHEYIAVENAKTIAQAYNAGIDNSKYKIKCFIHQDARILDPNFIKKLERIFKNDKVGIVGVVGSLDNAGGYRLVWNLGSVHLHNETHLILHAKLKGLYETCNVVDGLILITNQDIRFDEKYNHFHFYDMDICKEINKMGKQVICANIMMQHSPDNGKPPENNDRWIEARERFLKKWNIQSV